MFSQICAHTSDNFFNKINKWLKTLLMCPTVRRHGICPTFLPPTYQIFLLFNFRPPAFKVFPAFYKSLWSTADPTAAGNFPRTWRHQRGPAPVADDYFLSGKLGQLSQSERRKERSQASSSRRQQLKCPRSPTSLALTRCLNSTRS